LEQQQKEIEELKAKALNKTTTNNAQTNNNNIKKQTNNITNNITINAFGKEKVDYLSSNPNYKKFMINCLLKDTGGIIDLMDEIYYNEEHPENHNIRKINKKDKFMKSYNGTKWELIFAKDGLEKVLNRINSEFLRFLEMMEDNNERVKDPIMRRFMMKVGYALEYDFTIFNYDYDCNLSDAKLKKLKSDMDSLYLFYINEKTKEQLKIIIENKDCDIKSDCDYKEDCVDVEEDGVINEIIG
jgi:hypothetical protein